VKPHPEIVEWPQETALSVPAGAARNPIDKSGGKSDAGPEAMR